MNQPCYRRTFALICLLLQPALCSTQMHLEQEKEKDILLSESEINEQDQAGNTPLHRALHTQQPLEIESLLKNPALNPSIANNNGQTIAHLWAEQTRLSESLNQLILKKLGQYPALFNIRDNTGNTPLHLALESGQNNIILPLLDKTDLILKNNYGDTPTHHAARMGNTLAIQQILSKKNESINGQNNAGNTPLHIAVANGHNNLVKQLLSNSTTNSNITNNKGMTPLHLAITSPNPLQSDILNQLIAQTNVQIKDQNGNTPLHTAVLANRIDIVQALLQQNSIIDWENNQGNTPLHLAAQLGYVPLVSLLLQHGAQANALNAIGLKPIDITSHETIINLLKPYTSQSVPTNPTQKIMYGTKTHNQKLVEEGIQQGGDINYTDQDGNTPLHSAVQDDNTSITQALLEHNADTGIQNQDGQTPLHNAVDANTQIFQKVISHSKPDDLQKQDRNGETALHRAVKRKNTKKTKGLIDADKDGKSLTIKNNEGQTPEALSSAEIKKLFEKSSNQKSRFRLAYALMKKKEREKKLKIDSDQTPIEPENEQRLSDQELSDLQALLQAIAQDSVESAATILAKKNITASSKTPLGSTPLHEAVSRGNPQMIALLLKENPDLSIKNSADQTVLELAVALNNASATEQILNHARTQNNLAALISKTENGTKTLLHQAAESGNNSIIQALIAAGFPVYIVDQTGSLALHYAVSNKKTSIEALQQLLGPNIRGINVPDQQGNTPLHNAVTSGSVATVQFLLTNDAHKSAENHAGISPLMLSAQQNRNDLFKLLVQENAAIYPQDAQGNTVLFYLPAANQTLYQAVLLAKQLPINPSVQEFLNPYYIPILAQSRSDLASSLLKSALNNKTLPITMRNRIDKILTQRRITQKPLNEPIAPSNQLRLIA